MLYTVIPIELVTGEALTRREPAQTGEKRDHDRGRNSGGDRDRARLCDDAAHLDRPANVSRQALPAGKRPQIKD